MTMRDVAGGAPMPGLRRAMECFEEGATAQRREPFRLMFEINPVPMWILESATLRVLAVNDAAVSLYGYSRAEFLRLRTVDLRLEEDREEFEQHMRRGGNMQGKRVWRHKLFGAACSPQ